MAFINVQPDVRIAWYLEPIAMDYLEHIIFLIKIGSTIKVLRQSVNIRGMVLAMTIHRSVSWVRELGSLSQSGGFGLASYS